MRRRIQEIIDKGNLSPALKEKIESYKKFEKGYFSGEGDVIGGIMAIDSYEREIVALSESGS